MKKMQKLKSLSDDELLRRLSDVLKESRRVESELVAHIAEVDVRRLYLRQASPSMFQYCIDVLNLSEAEAYLRIGVARASRKHPMLLTMLADGRLHLSGIVELAPHLTDENCDELLARATHKTKAAIQEIVAEIAPKPDAPTVIRKLPQRKTPASAKASARPRRSSESGGGKPAPQPPPQELRPDGVASSPAPVSPAPAPPDKPAVVEPLAPSRYKIQFTASGELRDKLERLTALMPGNDLASVVEAAVTEKIERLEAKRFGKSKKPRKSVEEADTSPGVRGISAPVRRFVWDRDGGQCTYSRNGRRCPAREGIEFHHDNPYGLGGDRSANNIRLMCSRHNDYMAERDYGKEKMDQYRVREPSPTLQLCPDVVTAAELLEESIWVERIPRLPQLQHHKSTQ